MAISNNSHPFWETNAAEQLAFVRSVRHVAYKAYISRLPVKTVGSYSRHIWQDMREYFHQEQDAFQFIDSVTTEIRNQYTRAWNEGARAVGVDPRDMSDPDLMALEDRIRKEYNFVLGLAEDIDNARYQEMSDASFNASFRGRADLWANRYTEVVNEAKVWFGQEKLEWQLGATEEHCSTCAMLNGVVAYAREWYESNIRPQNAPNPMLECGGWRCDCKLVPTTKRKTRGGIPRL